MLDRPAASQQEELKAQNVAALNWTETLFHLVSGSLVMVHAVLLPFRSAFTSIGWGAYTDRPALQYPELAGYCVSIYFVDVAFLVLHSTPLVRNQARSASPPMLCPTSATCWAPLCAQSWFTPCSTRGA